MPEGNVNGSNSSWNQWSKYVLKALEELGNGQRDYRGETKADIKELDNKIDELSKHMIILKTKMQIRAGTLGFVFGLIPVAIALLIFFLSK